MKPTKTKKQVIVVPTTQKTMVKTKPVKTLTKSRPIRSKSNTLAYYNCLIDQVANPVNDKVKITKLAHHCKCKKGEVAVARQEHKAQLVQKLAQSYKNFGESLGHYLHADIVGCAKELKK
ncbi:2459_t:CDS:1 [Funneliformis geosporum]|uniref:13395_t:CDS:1 n=1 Tax=Funneliformis geosporum TaxID=1117311 RepID=A0A9W4T3B2_9GLOM|nr:2459_t:CDS:1 [Funneliformis geosporum]CAI2190896.1 13395_t:CDS:1 [Funneliformis geosporum]